MNLREWEVARESDSLILLGVRDTGTNDKTDLNRQAIGPVGKLEALHYKTPHCTPRDTERTWLKYTRILIS